MNETLLHDELLELISEQHLSYNEVINLIVKNQNISSLLKSAPTFSLKINTDYSIKELVNLANFDWSEKNLSEEYFTLKKKVLTSSDKEHGVTMKLLHLKQRITSDKLISKLSLTSCRVANIIEVLNFAYQYPSEQLKHPILALGSIWCDGSGNRRVACLVADAKRRAILLYPLGRYWDENVRFLVSDEKN